MLKTVIRAALEVVLPLGVKQSIIFHHEAYNTLDPAYLFIFLENIAHNYNGSQVRLKDQKVGEIIFINAKNPSRPLIELMNGTMIDLSFVYKKKL